MPYASETLLPSGTVSNRLYASVIGLTFTGVMACGEVICPLKRDQVQF